MSHNYAAGRRFEYEVRTLLEHKGWTVFRSAGSRKIDLIAFRHRAKPLWISCKYGRSAPSDRSWLDKALWANAIYVEARKMSDRKVKWTVLQR